jgi:hypothetical protein
MATTPRRLFALRTRRLPIEMLSSAEIDAPLPVDFSPSSVKTLSHRGLSTRLNHRLPHAHCAVLVALSLTPLVDDLAQTIERIVMLVVTWPSGSVTLVRSFVVVAIAGDLAGRWPADVLARAD